MKWLIVEDALRDRKGHWLEYVSTFVRELRALGDEVVVLCDQKAQGFVMEQTGARPALPESIWHRMGDGAGALKRYLRVPGHAIATFFAMRKVLRGFNHGLHGLTRMGEAQGDAQGTCAGAAFSNPLTSELARDAENSSLTRSAIGPALAAMPPMSDGGPVEYASHSTGERGLVAYSAGGAKALDSGRSTLDSSPAQALDAGRWTLDSGEAPDWIFVPTVLVHHLLGWWLLLKTGSVPGDSRVLLFFPNLPIRLDDEGLPLWTGGPTTKLMAWLFAQLRGEVENGKVVLGVETHAMRRTLEGLIRIPVVYLPHPVPAKPGQGEARGEGRGASKCEDVLTTEDTEGTEELESGAAQAGASESGALAIKLVELPVSESPIRSTDTPASFLPATSRLPPITAPEALNAFLPATSYSPLSTSAKPIVFGCYGAARWEKGSDIFQEAIKLILSNEVSSGGCRVASVGPDGIKKQDSTGHDSGLLIADGVPGAKALDAGLSTLDSIPTAARRPLRFAIQWVEDFQDDSGNLVSIDPWLRKQPQVEVIERYFEGNEYEQRLAQTDVMVLPYRSPYRLRVSRVVIEAMLNGMPVIATRGTTLFEQAEEYGVVVGCEEGNAESLADAMLEVAAKFEILRARAAEKVNAAAESFSVGHFRDLLPSKMCFASMSPS